MHDLYVEERAAHSISAVTWDIARHMYVRVRQGRVAVVTDQPTILRTSLQKQWHKLIRKAQQERADTTNAIYILEISQQIAHMQAARFTLGAEHYQSDVAIATSQAFLRSPPVCQTMYIAGQVPKETRYMLTAWMPKHCALVYYA